MLESNVTRSNDENFSKKAFTRLLILEEVLNESEEMTEAEKDSVYLFGKCLKMDDEKRRCVVQFAKAICTHGT